MTLQFYPLPPTRKSVKTICWLLFWKSQSPVPFPFSEMTGIFFLKAFLIMCLTQRPNMTNNYKAWITKLRSGLWQGVGMLFQNDKISKYWIFVFSKCQITSKLQFCKKLKYPVNWWKQWRLEGCLGLVVISNINILKQQF